MARRLSVRWAALAVGCWALVTVLWPAMGIDSGYRHEPIRRINDHLFRSAGDGVTEVFDLTRSCLGCHDGSVGPRRAMPTSSGGSCLSPRGAHPVGVPYPTGKPEWVSVESLPSAMYLDQGLTTCASCHSVEAADHGLILPLQRGALCLACHNK